MTYSSLIEEEGIRANFLIVVKPRREATGFALVSSTIYKTDFDWGNVISVTYDGNILTEDTSVTVAPGKFYYDFDNEELYINTGVDPTSDFIVATYELFYSTLAAHWYRIPTDDSTRTIFYDPLVTKPPQFKAMLSDTLFGFLPSQSSTIVFNNAEHVFEKHVYNSSFAGIDVEVYHWLGTLDVTNIKLVLRGKGQNIAYRNSQVTLSVLDRIDILDQEYRNPNESFYSFNDFPDLQPTSEGASVRYIYGMAEGIKFVNVDFLDIEPTTSENRIWAVRDDGALTNEISTVVPASPSSTVTRTYVTSANGINVGDRVKIDKATDEYKEVTLVNKTGSHYIEHSALVSGAAATSDTVERGTVGNININQNGEIFKLYYDRDWTESVSNGILVVTFPAGMEAAVGMTTLASSETVYGRVYGKKVDTTIGGSPFGTDSTNYGGMTDPAVVFYDILKSRLGLEESEINTSSFTTLSGVIGAEEVGFAIPEKAEDSHPTYKDLLLRIIETNLVRFFINNDQLWEVNALRVLGSSDFTIANDEILDGSINYSFDTSDMKSDIIVKYRFNETLDSSLQSLSSSDSAKWLHMISKQKTLNSVLLNEIDADDLAARMKAIFGERKGRFDISSKNRFFSSKISDVITVNLEKLPGFEYTKGTIRTREFGVLEINKGLRQTNLTLDDQLGIENNSGDF